MLSKNMRLTRARTPESAGVSSEAFIKTLKYLEEKNVLYHSLMVVRHGKVAAECYREPFSKDIPHVMYSVSKTITATAIGFAIDEGYIKLETRFVDIFPEFSPKKRDEKLEKLEVRHLLTMTSGKQPSYLLSKTDKDWMKHFTDAKWISEPGEKFEYVNENIYVLCAILHRVTGISVTDFLYERLFLPLGIEKPFWETDHDGIEAGGWGIFLKTEDLAKIMLCYLNEGKFGKNQVIPKDWAKKATLNQAAIKGTPIREKGYGYCIWTENENEYRADGMYSQLGVVLEDKDAVIVFTSCSVDVETIWSAFDILKAEGFIKADTSVKSSPEYKEFVKNRPLDIVPLSERRSPLEDIITGRTIKFKNDLILNTIGSPLSVLSSADVYMSKNRAGNINNVSFDFSINENELMFTWQEKDEVNTISCGLDGKYRFTPIVLAGSPYTAAAAAYWLDNYTLEVWIRPIESLARRVLRFSFQGDSVVMTPTGEPPAQFFLSSVSDFVRDMFSQKQLKDIAGASIKVLESLLEPLHYGKFID
ncbi:MAG TPA: serine hydrolase [Oscillospiraceae bacterium]|nr:serine hydrolase [Oscillospiraceae bacterium]